MYASAYRPRDRSELMRLRLAAVGSRRYRTGTSGIACRVAFMFLYRTNQHCVRNFLLEAPIRSLLYAHSQMYCHAPSSQVIDPQDARYYILPKAIEDENLPDGVSIRVRYSCSVRNEAISSSRIMVGLTGFGGLSIEIEDPSKRC